MRNLLAVAFLSIIACQNKQESIQSSSHPVPVAPTGLAGSQKVKSSKRYSGRVLESITKDQFSYIRIGDNWFALLATQIKTGDDVVIEEQVTLNNFHSKVLNKTFKTIVFGSVESRKSKRQF